MSNQGTSWRLTQESRIIKNIFFYSRDCYLGKVKANAMVTNKDYPPEFINSFINLFKYAQQFYGQRNSDEFSFSMFFSPLPYSDLIFQDAAQKLIIIPEGMILEFVGRYRYEWN